MFSFLTGGGGVGTEYKGTWDANANSPTLGDLGGGGSVGDYYIVSVAGTTSIDGNSSWAVGDWIVHNGSTWQIIVGGAAPVSSVNTQTGDVLLESDDIPFDNTSLGLPNAPTDVFDAVGSLNVKIEKAEQVELGENLSPYTIVYKATDGKLYKCDNTNENKIDVLGLCVAGGTAGETKTVLQEASITNVAWSFDIDNNYLYLDNLGQLTESFPSVGDFVVECAKIISATSITFYNTGNIYRI